MSTCCRSGGWNQSKARRSWSEWRAARSCRPTSRTASCANTEGVPLFVEELTKTVLDSGLLVEAGDRYLAIGPLPAMAIPSTLQDLLMARLDRLSPVKETAQIGACIGRVFQHRLLAAVSGAGRDRLDDALRPVGTAELLFRSSAAPEATYTFKHALVRDTAYQSLLKSRRQQIHAKIAAALEAEFADVAETEPETVAQHYTLAGLAAAGRVMVAESRTAGD